MIRHLLLYALLISGQALSGQTSIFGRITDAETGAPAEFVQVVLYRYRTNEVVAFRYTDEQGRYELLINDRNTKAFTLKTNSLGYENVEKDIFLDTREQGRRFEVNLQLRPKAHQLQEAQVSAKRPPLIVKQDTIVYHTEHWTDEFDQSLEAVLAKIPGFEILEGGEIKVNGKLVNKVLINGEEISDGGAALITRNLTPGRVKSVEVRFDEKNDKIRNSILSTNAFVVLDIKLKDDFNQSLFGRIHAGAGYMDDPRPGAVAKLFSLNEKAKFQMLGEWDEFGEKTISLDQIRNLGAEALQQIFEVPADFNRLRENPEYNNEVYGFREYVGNRAGSIGATGKITISPAVDLFLGTFNYTDRIETRQDLQQSFLADPPLEFAFDDRQSFLSAHSKNKLELVANPKDMKIKYNFNAVLSQVDLLREQRIVMGPFYNFSDRGKSGSFYHNLHMERRFSASQGIQFSLMYNASNLTNNRILEHDNPVYAAFFDPQHNEANLQLLRQRIPTEQRRLLGNVFYQTQWKGQQLKLGTRYLRDALSGQKLFSWSMDMAPEHSGHPLAASYQTLQFNQVLPYLEHQFEVAGFNLSNKIGLAFNTYPDGDANAQQTKQILEWKGSLSRSFTDGSNFSFSYAQHAAPFPLYQLLAGQEMVNFQTLAIPGNANLTPQRERLISFSATTFALAHHGLAFEIAGLNGKAFNSPSFGFNATGLIEQYFDQIPSRYYLLVSKIAKTFEKIPLQMKLEPSLIHQTSFNRDLAQDGELTSVSSQIAALDYRAFTTFKEKTYNFETRIKWTHFSFSNETGPPLSGQRMWNVLLKYKQSLLQRNLLLSTSWRYASFSGAGNAELLLMDAGVNYIRKKSQLALQLHNLFNSRAFITQDITPAVFSTAQRFIFGRYARISFICDIN